jgi:hypothetical protein
MRGRGLAFAVLAAAWGVGAHAEQATPSAEAGPAACDFFAAQLIGVFCGHTAYLAPAGQFSEETIKRTTTTRQIGRIPARTTVERWDYRSASESATVAFSPWQGVRFHASADAFQFDDSYQRQSTPPGGGGFHFLGASSHADGGGLGWQEIGAEATVWDRQTDSTRTVFNLAGGLQLFGGGGPYRSRDLQQVGWESGAEWRLGGSGLSLDYFSATFLQRFDNPSALEAQSTSRLLLASDAFGVAIGPRLEGTSVLWHGPGVSTGWSEARLGGEALVEPFRLTPLPVLRDMTLDVAATHSLGQAELVPDLAGRASAYIVAASARFNFRF